MDLNAPMPAPEPVRRLTAVRLPRSEPEVPLEVFDGGEALPEADDLTAETLYDQVEPEFDDETLTAMRKAADDWAEGQLEVRPPEYPPGSKIFRCPLSCDWEYLVEALDVTETSLAEVFGMGVMRSVAAQRQMEQTERELEQHLTSHSTAEWAAELRRKDVRIAELTGRLEEAGRVTYSSGPVTTFTQVPLPPPGPVHRDPERAAAVAATDARLAARGGVLRPAPSPEVAQSIDDQRRAARDAMRAQPFDPVTATPRYSADDDAGGIVGIRR